MLGNNDIEPAILVQILFKFGRLISALSHKRSVRFIKRNPQRKSLRILFNDPILDEVQNLGVGKKIECMPT